MTTKIILKFNNPTLRTWQKPDEVYMAFDSDGYPYGVSIDKARDFKTVEAAREFAGNKDDFSIIELKTTYTEKVIVPTTMSDDERRKQNERDRLSAEIADLQAKLKAL
ncbi:hypothetical protein pf16_20 [Pseudomonas phage pf16]|uniref:Uncharacterized protein n=1 Tax=Pseudomonas phage pf16 TaxID=1815630 RepID=A0A1S5R3R3_9CAUD|nr:hypothetical protein FDG98_gp019 [Pseudomonas phage pf16]AND74943.1 hypothetical protein pf16_20 [Pseudomonas phage pf16]